MAPSTPVAADGSVTVSGAPAVPVAPAPPVGTPTAVDGVSNTAAAVAPPARRNRQPRRDGLAPSSATISGVPPLLELAASSPFQTRNQHQVSTFVPSFVAAAFTINAMNYHMSHTDRFLRGAPMWLPPMSLAYFGILFIVQTLRAQREVSLLDSDSLWFLEGFEKFYDLRSLLIAGPLVPYFQALAAHSGPFEWIGDICPTFPAIPALGQDAAHIAINNLHWILPNIPLYIDMLQKVRALAQDITTADEIFRFMDNIMQQPAAAKASGLHHMYTPGASFLVAYSIDQMNKARRALQFVEFPPRLNITGTNTTAMSIAQFCRFYNRTGTFYGWFTHIAATMQRYCGFMNGSVPMSAIPPAGTSAGSISWSINPNNTNLVTPYTFTAAAGAAPAHYLQHPLQSLAAQGSHSDPQKEEVEEQTSLIAQVATRWNRSGVTNAPAQNTILSGPYWNLSSIRESGTVDYAQGVSSKIEARYHVDTRQT